MMIFHQNLLDIEKIEWQLSQLLMQILLTLFFNFIYIYICVV